MIRLIYPILLALFKTGVSLHALINNKSRRLLAGRKEALSYLNTHHVHNQPLIWVHCASVGEYEQGRPVIEAIRHQYPEMSILLTFFSPSGLESVATDAADYQCLLPSDFRKNAQHFVKITRPVMAIFVKYEFWYNYLKALKDNNIPSYCISAVFRPQFPYFKWYGGFYRQMLRLIDKFMVQDIQSQQLLQSIGINAVVCGDSRVDRVVELKLSQQPFPGIETFVEGDEQIMIFGSLRKGDLPLVLPFIHTHHELKYIIAPHEVEGHVIKVLRQEFPQSQLYSTSSTHQRERNRILLIDCVGILSRLYRFADFAYIGGAFDDGLHNILEPAIFQLPLFFGNKKFDAFIEAIELIDMGAAFPVGSFEEFSLVFHDLIATSERKEKIRNQIAAYIQKQTGATHRILKEINFDLP